MAVAAAAEVPGAPGALHVEPQALELRVAELPPERRPIEREAVGVDHPVHPVGGAARGDAEALGGLAQCGMQLRVGDGGAPAAGGQAAARAVHGLEVREVALEGLLAGLGTAAARGVEVGLDGGELVGEHLTASGLHGGAAARVLAVEAAVDLVEHAAAHVEGAAVGLELLLEGVGASRHGLGLEGLGGEGDGHLAAEHTGEVVLERDDVDELERVLVEAHHDVAAHLHVSGAQRRGAGHAGVLRVRAGAEAHRVADDGRPIELQTGAAAPHDDALPVERGEAGVLGVGAEGQGAAAHAHLGLGVTHGDAHRLHGERAEGREQEQEECNRSPHGGPSVGVGAHGSRNRPADDGE